MGKYTEKILTLTAGEALLKYRRVKVKSGTATDPVEVVYADGGEQALGVVERDTASGSPVAIRYLGYGGSVEGCALSSFARGATLYSAASGRIDDAASGTSTGIALEAATASGDIVEYIPFPVISTTAATVSIADAGGFTAQTTVEAAEQEIYQHILSAQLFIPIPLTAWMIGDGTNTVSYGGPATDPILDYTNGDTDSALRFTWAAASVEEIICQVPLPPNLDVTADLVLHMWCGKDANANTVTLASDAYFNVGDTKVEDVTATIAQTAAETTITIAAADVPAGAQTLTIELTPSAHAGDALYLYATWLEYTGILRTS